MPPASDRGRVVVIGHSIAVDSQKQAVLVRGTEATPAIIRLGSGKGAVTVTASEIFYSEKEGRVTAAGRGTISLSQLR